MRPPRPVDADGTALPLVQPAVPEPQAPILIGIATTLVPDGIRRTAIFAGTDEPVLATVGDVVFTAWVVETVSEDAVRLRAQTSGVTRVAVLK